MRMKVSKRINETTTLEMVVEGEKESEE